MAFVLQFELLCIRLYYYISNDSQIQVHSGLSFVRRMNFELLPAAAASTTPANVYVHFFFSLLLRRFFVSLLFQQYSSVTLLINQSINQLIMATPPKEIQRQHEEACSLLDTPPIERVDNGEIPLTQKQHPTSSFLLLGEEEKKHELEQHEQLEQQPHIICISSRGQADVAPLQDLIREGYNEPKQEQEEEAMHSSSSVDEEKPLAKNNNNNNKNNSPSKKKEFSPTNLWDDKNASTHNCSVTRPSHDAWGIKKIVLVFCDDFLDQVFEMPWWHLRDDIRQAIQPIIKCLSGVQPDRIVRMLLAALPPGVTIPVHHDTGAWVRKTHRVHVPILMTDPMKVLFRCGPTTETLSRIDCTPGHVFEMNNQAKHAVSNCGVDHRVHLILDFVDDDFQIKRRVKLDPGERLLQTRRSIDRLVERGSRPTPTYMILGAQKAGTTSLYEYIVQHPLAVRARRRETHCLDWRWNDDKHKSTTKARRDHCLEFFQSKALDFHPSCLTGDSTPSYLLDSKRVIPRLKEVFPHPIKFFVMVRDPVARAYSHFSMVTSNEGTPAQLQVRGTEWRQIPFQEVVQQEMQKLHDCGLIPYFDIQKGLVDRDAFDAFSGSKAENDAWDRFISDIPLNTGSHSLLARGLYELQLRPWFKFFDRERFMCIKLEEMKKDGMSKFMDRVWDHLNLPRYEVEDESPKNTRSYDPMSEDTKAYLQRFYAPHNEKMEEVLGIAGWNYKT